MGKKTLYLQVLCSDGEGVEEFCFKRKALVAPVVFKHHVRLYHHGKRHKTVLKRDMNLN